MKKVSIILLALLIGMIGNGCGHSEVAPTKKIHVGVDYKVVSELPEMVEESELVVIGTFGPYQESYNSDRDMKDPSKPSKDSYSEGKIYQFEVSETLKGKIDSSAIRVEFPHSREITGLKDEKGKDLKIRAKDTLSFTPEPQKKYVLFLQKDKFIHAYLAPFYPNILEVDDNERVMIYKPAKEEQRVKAESGELYGVTVEGVNLTEDLISGKSLEEIRKSIKNNQS